MAKKRPNQRKKTRFPIGITLLVVVGVGALIGFRVLQDRPAQAQTVSAEVLELGAEKYAASCAGCHGVDGAGNTQVGAPGLNGSAHSWHHDDGYLINQLRYGGMGMPAVAADWTDEEVDAVISYFKSWWDPQQRAMQPGDIGE